MGALEDLAAKVSGADLRQAVALAAVDYSMDAVRQAFEDQERRRRASLPTDPYSVAADVDASEPYDPEGDDVDWGDASPGNYCYVREVWTDHIIVEGGGRDSSLFSVPYTVKDASTFTFGKATPVKVSYVPLSDAPFDLVALGAPQQDSRGNQHGPGGQFAPKGTGPPAKVSGGTKPNLQAAQNKGGVYGLVKKGKGAGKGKGKPKQDHLTKDNAPKTSPEGGTLKSISGNIAKYVDGYQFDYTTKQWGRWNTDPKLIQKYLNTKLDVPMSVRRVP